jgi:hypothetical protein
MKTLRYLLPFLFLVLPLQSFAHGLVTTQSAVVGDYDIEFEYNTIGNVLVGDYTLYDVYLLKNGTRDGVDFDSAFIRIEKQNGPAILSGNLAEAKDIKGYASMSGILTEAGVYTAEVSFYKDSKTFAESKFDFTVEKNQFDTSSNSTTQKNSLLKEIGLAVLGLVIGVAGTVLISWKGKKA